MKFIISILIAASTFIFVKESETYPEYKNSDNVSDVLDKLGSYQTGKYPNTAIKNVSVAAGRSIVHEGFGVKEDGSKSGKQSSHFLCTSCHNTVQEDPDLGYPDPQERLIYTNEKGIPFLQATTLYGAVNRETYYNGDYEKKYGDLVYAARNDIRNAIQLCATECAQGRELKDWELESILSYLWTIQLKMGDLQLAGEQTEFINLALAGREDKEDAVAFIKSRYLSGSPATFVPPPADRKKGSGLVGNADNGALIYKNSCLHCHYQQRYSYFHLDESKMSIRHLKKDIASYGRHSIYQVVRWGVPVKSGKRSYMPQYTAERMSDQQLADLRAFLEKEG